MKPSEKSKYKSEKDGLYGTSVEGDAMSLPINGEIRNVITLEFKNSRVASGFHTFVRSDAIALLRWLAHKFDYRLVKKEKESNGSA